MQRAIRLLVLVLVIGLGALWGAAWFGRTPGEPLGSAFLRQFAAVTGRGAEQPVAGNGIRLPSGVSMGGAFTMQDQDGRSVTQADFDTWVKEMKTGTEVLDRADYMVLEKPTAKEPVRHYAQVEPALFNRILNRCVAEGTMCMNQQMHEDHKRNEMAAAIRQLPKDGKSMLAEALEMCVAPFNTVKK